MASMFNTLYVGYSGLSAAQVGINTTGHNISNAEVDGYSRQRVTTEAAAAVTMSSGQIGNGTDITDIQRVFDNFVFERYSNISGDKEYSDYEQKNLEVLSTYFPEIDGVGVKSDLAEYYNMWQTLSDNPDNDAIKLALAKKTEDLSSTIQQTQSKVMTLQAQMNDELITYIDEVNSIAKELSELNKSIDAAEAGNGFTANDLRDQRNMLEKNLSQLIGAEVTTESTTSDIGIDSTSNTRTGSYTVSVNGFNIVDGGTFHEIHATNDNFENGFYQISYERQDGKLIPMEESLNGGKIGAIMTLRGGEIDSRTGIPVDGVFQETIEGLDSFANGLIEATNNLYAASATTSMQSNVLDMSKDTALINSGLNIKEGSFNLLVYDIDGNEVAKRNIKIDIATVMSGNAESIEGQIKVNKDDNADGNTNNDIDDFFANGFNFIESANGELRLGLSLDALSESRGYTFAIEDELEDSSFSSGSNFAGALGLQRFFDGDDASSIKLNTSLAVNSNLISSGKSPVNGDNTLALDMLQTQYERYDFKMGSDTYSITANSMFDLVATQVGTATNSAILRNETISTQFNAIESEYFSVSKVSIDEEMTNLIKYQTSYGAAAKVITTIDEMMQTLLGIKQ